MSMTEAAFFSPQEGPPTNWSLWAHNYLNPHLLVSLSKHLQIRGCGVVTVGNVYGGVKCIKVVICPVSMQFIALF